MESHITVVGSINTDLVIRTTRVPLPGETITGRDFKIIAGGKGANQAVAAARQGANVTLIGSIGADDFGRQQQDGLRREQIDISFLTADKRHATGVAMITLDEAGQNSIIVSPEANGAVTVDQIDAARDAIARSDMLLCQLEIPLDAVTRAIEIAHANDVPVLLNPAPAQHFEPSLLQKVTYLIPNEFEAGFLTGVDVHDTESAQKAAVQLQTLGVATVILTLGEQGAVIADAGQFCHEPALVVDAVDTTAAGDTFVGSFAVARTEGKSVVEAVRFAKHAAALAVTKLGAQPSVPTRAEVEQYMSGTH